MAKHIAWSKYEIALLFMVYERIANGSNFEGQSFWLSGALRQLASVEGIAVDETFRNINGINMQLNIVQYLFTNGEKGLPGASRAFRDMYDLYVNNHDKFNNILDEATKMLEQDCKIIAPSPTISITNSTPSHKSVKRISWDKYESVLLFKAYENIASGKNFMLEAVTLSNTLRQYAINRGIEIDDTY